MSVTLAKTGWLFHNGRLEDLRIAFLTEQARARAPIPESLVYYIRALEAEVITHDARDREKFAEESMSFRNLGQEPTHG